MTHCTICNDTGIVSTSALAIEYCTCAQAKLRQRFGSEGFELVVELQARIEALEETVNTLVSGK